MASRQHEHAERPTPHRAKSALVEDLKPSGRSGQLRRTFGRRHRQVRQAAGDRWLIALAIAASGGAVGFRQPFTRTDGSGSAPHELFDIGERTRPECGSRGIRFRKSSVL